MNKLKPILNYKYELMAFIGGVGALFDDSPISFIFFIILIYGFCGILVHAVANILFKKLLSLATEFLIEFDKKMQKITDEEFKVVND